MKMKKPKCYLVGTDGNVFALAAKVSKTLKDNGMKSEAKEMFAKLKECSNYDEALMLFEEYVEVV